MAEECAGQAEGRCEAEESFGGPVFEPRLYVQRYYYVQQQLRNHNVTSVVDFGCAECKVSRFLVRVPTIEQISLVDLDCGLLEAASGHMIRPGATDFLERRERPLAVRVYCGSVTDLDPAIVGCDAVSMIELIEHLHADTLAAAQQMVFGSLQPRVVVITTPNADFNVLFPGFTGFRHWDHKFEWTRQEFQEWCKEITSQYPYSVEFGGIGDPPGGSEHLGHCSQAAVFVRTSKRRTSDKLVMADTYKLVAESTYPHRQVSELSEEEATLMELRYLIRQYAHAYTDLDDADNHAPCHIHQPDRGGNCNSQACQGKGDNLYFDVANTGQDPEPDSKQQGCCKQTHTGKGHNSVSPNVHCSNGHSGQYHQNQPDNGWQFSRPNIDFDANCQKPKPAGEMASVSSGRHVSSTNTLVAQMKQEDTGAVICSESGPEIEKNADSVLDNAEAVLDNAEAVYDNNIEKCVKRELGTDIDNYINSELGTDIDQVMDLGPVTGAACSDGTNIDSYMNAELGTNIDQAVDVGHVRSSASSDEGVISDLDPTEDDTVLVPLEFLLRSKQIKKTFDTAKLRDFLLQHDISLSQDMSCVLWRVEYGDRYAVYREDEDGETFPQEPEAVDPGNDRQLNQPSADVETEYWD